MAKRTIWQAFLAVLFAASAAVTGLTLADHDVPPTAIGYTVIAISALGMNTVRMAGQPRNAIQAYRCITPGCDFEIRSASTDSVNNASLRLLAGDHSQHGPVTA